MSEKLDGSTWFIRVDSSFTTYLDDSERKPELYLITSFEADPGIFLGSNPKLRTHAFNQECWFDGIPSFLEFCEGIETQLYSVFDSICIQDFDEIGPEKDTPVHISFVFTGEFAENFKKMTEGISDEGLKPWMITLRDSNIESEVENGDILFETFTLDEIIGDKVKESVRKTNAALGLNPETKGVL